jgi:hypothetical protein
MLSLLKTGDSTSAKQRGLRVGLRVGLRWAAGAPEGGAIAKKTRQRSRLTHMSKTSSSLLESVMYLRWYMQTPMDSSLGPTDLCVIVVRGECFILERPRVRLTPLGSH